MHLVECSHFIVPELGPETKFSYSSQKAVNEYREAKQVELAPDLLSYLFLVILLLQLLYQSLSSILVDVNAVGGVILKLFLILHACPWQLGIETVPVLVGPVTYLHLSKAEKSAPKDFDLLSLLDSILPVYK